MTLVLIMFVVLGVLLALETPIAAALGVSALAGALYLGAPLGFLASGVCGALEKWQLLAIPFFVMAGLVLGRSGIARRLVDLASAIIGGVPGGLAIVTIVVSVFFAGISGSGPADVAALGLILIPAMVSAGYDRGFASALMAICGGIGIIVPPSIALILYGVVAGRHVSIRDLFLAGVLPGVVVGVMLILYVLIRFRKKRDDEVRRGGGLREIGRAFVRAFWGLLAPVIILGGIYSGVFTPTESAAVAVMYAVVVDLLVYRELSFKDVWRIASEGGIVSAKVLIVVACASLFAIVLQWGHVPSDAAEWLASLELNRWVMLLLVNALLLVVGCFLDAISIIYIFVPILLEPLIKMGVNPIHFGIVLTVNLAIGQVTPPVGVNLFVAAGISKAPLNEISRAALKLVLVGLIALALITYVPAISLWLPETFPQRRESSAGATESSAVAGGPGLASRGGARLLPDSPLRTICPGPLAGGP